MTGNILLNDEESSQYVSALNWCKGSHYVLQLWSPACVTLMTPHTERETTTTQHTLTHQLSLSLSLSLLSLSLSLSLSVCVILSARRSVGRSDAGWSVTTFLWSIVIYRINTIRAGWSLPAEDRWCTSCFSSSCQVRNILRSSSATFKVKNLRTAPRHRTLSWIQETLC